jgi:hypothetical protein
MATGNARVILPAETVTLDPARVMGGLNEFERRHAPERLYACGDVSLLDAPARVAVVGSRNASLPGRKRVAKLVGALIERDVVIVSGLAAGIDTAAHEETLQRGGRTIAVLGTPLDEAHPPSNAPLQRRLMEGASSSRSSRPVILRCARTSPDAIGPWPFSVTPR